MSRFRIVHGSNPTPPPPPVNAVNTVAPAITGTRGGALTAVPGTWTGATGGVTGQWYADGVATGNTTLAFTDSDTTKTIEYRETALPGSITASAWDGTVVTPPDFSEDFNSYADGTRLAQFLSNGTTQTATPHVLGWVAKSSSSDINGAGDAQDLRIYSGKVKRQTGNENGYVHYTRDMGSPGGVVEYTLPYDGVGDYRFFFILSSNGNQHAIQVGVRNAAGIGMNVSIMLDPLGAETAVTNITGLPVAADGAKLKVRLDDTGKRIYLFLDNVVIGSSAGYDLSAWAGPWTNNHGMEAAYGTQPPVGQPICDALTYTTLQTNMVATALVAQSSGTPGKKQLNVTASTFITGATGLQYKVETEAGALVQGWTNTTTFSGGVGTATFLIPDFAYEGQKFRVIARNVGGTVKIVSQLTIANGYALQQTMRVGLNDTFKSYWVPQIASRDIFEYAFQSQPNDAMFLVPVAGGAYHDAGILPPGTDFPAYAHWNEVYNPVQNYPSSATTTDDNYVVCVYNGAQWARTTHTPRAGTPPDPADSSGTVSGWRRAYYASGTLVGLTADGRPTHLPTDVNLTLSFSLPWRGFKASRFPVTVHGKTEAGVTLNLTGAVNVSKTNTGSGTFDLTFSADGQGAVTLDRSTPISSAFFLSGVPSYETGAPALDVGAPYPSIDKLADFAPFYACRDMTSQNINRSHGGAYHGLTAANSVPAGGRREWKDNVDLANRCGHKATWPNTPDLADDTYQVAQAQYYFDNLTSSIVVLPEWCNENWLNGGGKNATLDLQSRAATNSITPIQQQCREHKEMVLNWRSVWGSSPRLQPVLSWQSVLDLTGWLAALDFENTYQYVSYIGHAGYFWQDGSGKDIASYTNTPTNIRNAVNTNSYATFETLADALMRTAVDLKVAATKAIYDGLATYSVSKGLGKNAIGFASYEFNHNIICDSVAQAAWDAGLGAGMGARAKSFCGQYARSAAYGATLGYAIGRYASQCPHTLMLFDYCGVPDAFMWGTMSHMSNQTDEPYATAKAKALIYNV